MMFSRRRFLAATTILAGAGMAFGGVPQAFAAGADANLVSLASFLSGKDVDPALVARAGNALNQKDESFAKAAAALSDFVSKGGFTDTDALAADPGFTPELQKTAQELLKALYLGYVGEPKGQAAHDGVLFVSFSQALAYGVTSPYTPIPSYSTWGSGYWAHLPTQG
ncbi:sorbitol dehydrogenase family protein [Pseudooceanicola sp. CBS1P-1]|uniref:Twin-arginine translocation signal domain-containing protein n=1 Tax=Pseudooceanicola albus TaxID=2692189 RepID=A0A6L7GAW3_9RHOB|nr:MULTISPECIES: sugar dehydrogenase complex small subunit [Pseudooceanicola]MBT9387036.1 sorbitol dehydrogenase family protein [Pseudooceanicola endophyticus]MXN21191.1 hypothetical protein [Pseudooceanicola albus]